MDPKFVHRQRDKSTAKMAALERLQTDAKWRQMVPVEGRGCPRAEGQLDSNKAILAPLFASSAEMGLAQLQQLRKDALRYWCQLFLLFFVFLSFGFLFFFFFVVFFFFFFFFCFFLFFLLFLEDKEEEDGEEDEAEAAATALAVAAAAANATAALRLLLRPLPAAAAATAATALGLESRASWGHRGAFWGMPGMRQPPMEKPKDIIAEDSEPDIDEAFAGTDLQSPEGPEVSEEPRRSVMSQRSKKDPRSSFYTFTLPQGLPENAASAPNRLLHEHSEDNTQRFMGLVQKRPRALTREIEKRRAECFETSVEFWRREAREVPPSDKPEELFADDPLPDVEKAFNDPTESLARTSLLSQRSKKDPRSSFYTFTLPPGLPDHEVAAPNRLLHENQQHDLAQFMHRVQQTKGRQLSKEVCMQLDSGHLWTRVDTFAGHISPVCPFATTECSGEFQSASSILALPAEAPFPLEIRAQPEVSAPELEESDSSKPEAWEQTLGISSPPEDRKSCRQVPEVPQPPLPPCNIAALQAEALAWEQANLKEPTVSVQPEVPEVPQPPFPPCNIAALQAEEGEEQTAGMLAEPSDEDDLPLSEMINKDQDDLPLSEMVSKGSSKPPRKRARRSSGATRPQVSMRLPLTFGKCHVENQRMDVPLTTKASYLEYFEQALISEMQQHLSTWSATGRCPDGNALRVEEVLLGPAKEDAAFAAMLFNRAKLRQGQLTSCAKNDLWVVLQGFGEALLFRSLWKGVTPKGRLLCAPVNEAAVQWLQQSNRLRSVTALCSGAFSSELLQVDTLRQWAAQDDVCAQLFGLEAAPDAMEPSVLCDAVPNCCAVELSQEQQEVLRHVAAWPGGQAGCIHVHGVFGSGKSLTLAASILMLHRLLESQQDPRHILLLCQTNVAVDGVLKTLLQLGFEDFVRLGNFQTMQPQVLHRAAGAGSASWKATVKDLKDALKNLQVGDAAIQEKVQALEAAVASGDLPPRPQEWRQRRLVAATSAALETAELGSLTAPFCFVDEASQLTEPAILHAFRKVSAQCAVLLGDPKQLPPRAMHLPLQRSALLRDFATKTLYLRTQYRCHPFIGSLCSRLFYENQLLNGVTAEDRSSALGPGVAPLAVVLSQGLESRVGQSYRHDAEVAKGHSLNLA
eukprot:s219_g37.t2